MTRLFSVLTFAAIGLVAVVSSAPAAKLPSSKEAFFRVTVKGTQTTTWTADHKPSFNCDSSYRGQGSERVTFASRRPVAVRAFSVGNGPVTLISGSGLAKLPTRGSVRRNGTETIDPPAPGCEVGDGGGGSGPPPRDCGTKPISSLSLTPAYDATSADRISLYSNPNPTKPDFKNCPMLGLGWRTFLSRDDKKRTAGEQLPRKDLFDRTQGKMIVIGTGTVRSVSDGITSTTKIQWELTLTRLKGGTPG